MTKTVTPVLKIFRYLMTDDLETLEEDTFPTANLDQGHTLHDLLDHLHAPVTKVSEHGSRGSEEEGHNEDEDEKGAKKDTNTGPDGDGEDTV
jgi:hypothetical protein